jgi:hypothetical protein
MDLPSARPGDHDEVVYALGAAARAWPVDRTESVVWVRNAAFAAERAGQTERALELALAAADLSEKLMSSAVMPTMRQFDPKAVTREMKAVVPKKR